jgi:hypothetical protein
MAGILPPAASVCCPRAVLPPARHLLAQLLEPVDDDGVFVGSTPSPDTRQVIKGRSNGLAMARGSLFFTQNGTLVSAPFDAGSASLTGEVTQIAPNVAAFSASEAGTLAYFATSRAASTSASRSRGSVGTARRSTTGVPRRC